MDTEQNTLPILPAVRSQATGGEIPVKETASIGDHVTRLPKISADHTENNTLPNNDGDHRGICCRKFQISHPKELR